jgi:hypothetical protein
MGGLSGRCPMKKVLIGGLAGFVVLLVGVYAIVWGLARGVDHAIDHTSDEFHGGKASPTAVELGAEFTHGDWKVSDGWSLEEESYGGFKLHGDVTNVGDSARSSLLTFRFMEGQRVLATAQCSTPLLDPGQVADLDCFSSKDLSATYDAIEVTAIL